MEQTETELIMLGTGNATVTGCYNTCFILRTEETTLLVDAGGGNGILNQLEKADVSIDSIHQMFVTHAHTDHILGAVWMIRIIACQKTFPISFLAENEWFARICFLTGNDLETSEVLYFAMFLHTSQRAT